MPYASFFSIPNNPEEGGVSDATMVAVLAALAAVVTSADKLIYATGNNTFDVTGFTAFARTLLAGVDAPAMRATLSLGTMAVQDASAVAITGGTAALTDNSANSALTVTQAGSGNVALFEDQASDPTPTIIDAAGTVVIGHTAALTVSISWKLQLHHNANNGASVGIHSWSTNSSFAGAPQINFSKNKSGVIGTLGSAPAVDDHLLHIRSWGDDGAAWREAGRISFMADGTVGASDMPGRIEFYTTPDGSATPTIAMTIKNDGKVKIGSGNPAQALDVTGAIIASQAIIVPTFTVATLPSAATYARGIIYVSNETGGATTAFSDGTNWRRHSDRAIVA